MTYSMLYFLQKRVLNNVPKYCCMKLLSDPLPFHNAAEWEDFLVVQEALALHI